MSNLIPEKVIRFLSDNIDSIAELEAMLILRELRGKQWSSASIAERLYLTEGDTESLLVKLANKGLITRDGKSPETFQYKPHNQELALLIDQLAEVYAKYLIPVTELVHRKSRRNIESFSDAFKIRKEK